MNSWSQENYNMSMEMHQMAPPLMPPMFMMPPNASGPPINPNMNMPMNPPNNVSPLNPPPSAPLALIGPVMPEDMNVENQDDSNQFQSSNNADEKSNQTDDVSSTQNQKRRSHDRDRSSHSRRDKGRNSDRNRRRSRSRDRRDRFNRNDRNDRRRDDRNRNDDRQRKTKWDNNDTTPVTGQQGMLVANNMGNMANMPMGMMTGMNMMQYPNMMNNMMAQTPMDGNQMQMMSMNMMGNMMPNMMDQNMMMMNQQMSMMSNQPIYISSGVVLPPIPGVSTPQRRERPNGCRTIFVGGLPPNINHESLKEMFQRFGNIVDVRSPKSGVYYIRFDRPECVEQAFFISGYRFRFHDQTENEATTIFVDYALNRDDQNEYEKNLRKREPTPPRVEQFSPNALTAIADKIKSETDFATAAHTLVFWLERGECNKKYANTFYSLIQASNNQIRRLFNEKMQLDDEFQNLKTTIKDKFAHVVLQFEQVAKILSAAKHQRVSDHFSKQQRRNIEMWLKMTEEVENIKEEYNTMFDEDEVERPSKNVVPLEKYEELKMENENLTYELEGYKNEAYLAKDEAERKFEKFKAHFIAQQALQNKQTYPPLPNTHVKAPPPLPTPVKPQPPPPTPDDDKVVLTGPAVPPSEAKLISILTAFLMAHPLGASLDYLVSYVRSMTPNVTQATVLSTLQKYTDIFYCKTNGVGACIEHRWSFITFDIIKQEV